MKLQASTPTPVEVISAVARAFLRGLAVRFHWCGLLAVGRASKGAAPTIRCCGADGLRPGRRRAAGWGAVVPILPAGHAKRVSLIRAGQRSTPAPTAAATTPKVAIDVAATAWVMAYGKAVVISQLMGVRSGLLVLAGVALFLQYRRIILGVAGIPRVSAQAGGGDTRLAIS